MTTITIDRDLTTYKDGSLYVLEQEELDVLDYVSWLAVREDTAEFATAMRADYILIHDREVGVIIPRRTAHAWYRTGEGRYYDKFGNTRLTAPTKLLVERLGASASLVNVAYVSKPRKPHIPALPPITVSSVESLLQDTREGRRATLSVSKVNPSLDPSYHYAPSASQRTKLSQYQEKLDSGMSIKQAHEEVYGDA